MTEAHLSQCPLGTIYEIKSLGDRGETHLVIKRGMHYERLPKCPKCNSEYTYEDGTLYVCRNAHEWSRAPVAEDVIANVLFVMPWKYASGRRRRYQIKDQRSRASSVVKVGTKVKNIRLVEGDHDIDCKIDGIGAMKLKSEFVKKA
jgi:protein PhnA